MLTSMPDPRWKFSFTSECMTLLHDQAFGAVMPSYATTMTLDRKLRAHPVPPVLQIAGFGADAHDPAAGPPVVETPALILQRHTVVLIRESNLLYLHRAYFARAVTDHPDDPLGSPFGTSVIAAYRSAWSLIALVRNLHAGLRHPTERMWFVCRHSWFDCDALPEPNARTVGARSARLGRRALLQGRARLPRGEGPGESWCDLRSHWRLLT
jgi:hypothetical protein